MSAGINGHICRGHSNPPLPPHWFCSHRRPQERTCLIPAVAAVPSSLKLLSRVPLSAEETAIPSPLPLHRRIWLLLESRRLSSNGTRHPFPLLTLRWIA